MSKTILFSRVFPKSHPKASQPTHFVEQIWNSITALGLPHLKNKDFPNDFIWSILPLSNYGCKFHTIRKGSRWKVGDKFSPRVWGTDINPKSGRSGAYHSKQIILSEDLIVKKIWNVEIFIELGSIYIGIRENENTHLLLPFGEVAKNDGLTFNEMQYWFNVKPNKPFIGQIICWNEKINY